MIEKIIILILLIAGLFGVLWLLLITFIFGNTYSGLIIKRKNADVKGATYKIIFWIKLIVPLGFSIFLAILGFYTEVSLKNYFLIPSIFWIFGLVTGLFANPKHFDFKGIVEWGLDREIYFPLQENKNASFFEKTLIRISRLNLPIFLLASLPWIILIVYFAIKDIISYLF